MSRLEEIISVVKSQSESVRKLSHNDLNWLILQAEYVQELEQRNKELEYASKYNGELNEFLQKRKLPPNTLGRHVVDVVMDYVEELEKDIGNYKKACSALETLESYSRKETQRYKQALEEILEKDVRVAKLIAHNALAGEPNETMD